MWVAIGLGMGVVALSAVVFLGARRRRAAPRALAAPERASLWELRPNDVVEHFGESYMVLRVVTYDESGDGWRMVHLEGEGRCRLLLVRGDELRVSWLCEQALELAVASLGAATVHDRGRSFRLVRWGRAVGREEVAGAVEALGSVHYYRYESAGGALLWVESWSEGTWLQLSGQDCAAGAVTWLPGDAVGVEG